MLDSYVLFSSDEASCRLGERDDDIENRKRLKRCKKRLIRISLAESCFKNGNIEKTDALFQGWLEQNPGWEWGWIAWSDCYWLWELHGGEEDFDKAETILKRALSTPGLSSKKHVKERYQKLQQRRNEYRLNLD